MSIVEALSFEEIIVIYQILYFSDTASTEEHVFIDVEKCLIIGRENGIWTCVGTKTREYKSCIVVERLNFFVKVFDRFLKIPNKISMSIWSLEETKKGTLTIEPPSN